MPRAQSSLTWNQLLDPDESFVSKRDFFSRFGPKAPASTRVYQTMAEARKAHFRMKSEWFASVPGVRPRSKPVSAKKSSLTWNQLLNPDGSFIPKRDFFSRFGPKAPASTRVYQTMAEARKAHFRMKSEWFASVPGVRPRSKRVPAKKTMNKAAPNKKRPTRRKKERHKEDHISNRDFFAFGRRLPGSYASNQ